MANEEFRLAPPPGYAWVPIQTDSAEVIRPSAGNEVEVQTVEFNQAAFTSGPIPSADELKAYDQLYPGAARLFLEAHAESLKVENEMRRHEMAIGAREVGMRESELKLRSDDQTHRNTSSRLGMLLYAGFVVLIVGVIAWKGEGISAMVWALVAGMLFAVTPVLGRFWLESKAPEGGSNSAK